MINNTIINTDVDLYYKLNILNESKIEIIYDNEELEDFDLNNYKKMIEDIYSDDIEDSISLQLQNNDNEYSNNDNRYSNNYNIGYNDFIINNNKNNNKIFKNKKKNKKNKIIQCEECGDDNIIEDTSLGILVCRNCGQVASGLIDSGAEWSQYNDDNKKDMNRCSHPISQLLPQSSMATTIAGSCPSRIKTLHGWSAMPYKERSLNEVFKIIHEKCAKGKIMKCIEDASKIMYKNIAECKYLDGKNLGKSVIIRGKNRMSVIAACVLYSCRKKDKTRTPKEVAELFGLKHTEITKGCKIFQKLAKITNIELKLNSVNPEQFITRFCEELRVKKYFMDQAIQIANNAQKIQIASVHTPISLATGSILMMVLLNDLNIHKKIIAEQLNVSHVTVSKAYKKLEPFTNLLTNNELCDRLSLEINKYQNNIELNDELKIKFIRFNIDIQQTFDNKYNQSSLYNILLIDQNDIYEINNQLITHHTIEIDYKLKQTENEFIKLNLNFVDDLYQINI